MAMIDKCELPIVMEEGPDTRVLARLEDRLSITKRR
jgi:hypothetical protein